MARRRQPRDVPLSVVERGLAHFPNLTLMQKTLYILKRNASFQYILKRIPGWGGGHFGQNGKPNLF